MKENEIFTFMAPNDAMVTAICLKKLCSVGNMTNYICYGQNRLFTMNEYYSEWMEETGEVRRESTVYYGEKILEYVVLPDYDALIEDYSHPLSF